MVKKTHSRHSSITLGEFGKTLRHFTCTKCGKIKKDMTNMSTKICITCNVDNKPDNTMR